MFIGIVSVTAAFTIRVNTPKVAGKWSPRSHIIPGDLREFKAIRWRVLFEALLIAECMAVVGVLVRLGGMYLAIVIWAPAVTEAMIRYLAWRIHVADYLSEGMRW